MSLASLGAAVILRAVEDVRAKDMRERQRAREFICRPNPELEFWCAVADFDASVIVTECRRDAFGLASRIKGVQSEKYRRDLARQRAKGAA